ncbi:Mu transposase C-terminal domain-containing protein [Bergeriella denitrificans]|uniref:Transposase n=1 Tax=Bergeriella denitrificans TaxID=494 RepID=A0A378UG77_BERDE|nr:Mu transposase C-terminal domain-containing protein [Bergeriella denitrificans]STZ76307.1 transposase [Bergeriella denitrificans]
METIGVNELIGVLGVSKQAISKRALKECWTYKEDGRLKKYLISGLPLEIQTAIKERQAAQILANASPAPLPSTQVVQRRKMAQLGLPVNELAGRLTDKQQDVSHARAVFVCEVLKMRDTAGMSLRAAAVYVENQIKSGLLPAHLMRFVAVANARSNGKRGIGWRTLVNWVKDAEQAERGNARLMALAPRKPKEARSLLEIAWLGDWLAVWANPNKPGFGVCYQDFARNWIVQHGIETLPSEDQVRYAHKKLPETVKRRGRDTGGAYKAILPYVSRDWLRFAPNTIWVGDGHGFKAKVAHPITGQPFQPEVTAIIDASTRYVVGWTVSLAESTLAHADALRVAMSQHEPPLMYYTDNGAGPTGNMLDDKLTGILTRLGIEHPTGLPGNPQGRGIIERLWQTVTIPLARTYETFVGDSADASTKTLNLRKLNSAMRAERQGKTLSTEQRRYRQKMPTFAQFMLDLKAAFEAYNAGNRHRELEKAAGSEYATPAAYRAMRLAAEAMANRPLDAVELELMYRPEEERTVSRGMVSLFNNIYFSRDLADYHGETVRVGYDLHDASEVIVKRMDGSFICKAKFEGNKVAAMPVARIEQLKEERVRRAVKLQEEKIALAKAELQPAIEHQPDFGLLVGNGQPVIEGEYELIRPSEKRYVMFESDLED